MVVATILLEPILLERRPGPRARHLHVIRPRQTNDPECSNAVALAAKHGEAEAVECEALASLGNRARLVNDEAGDRRCFIDREVPVHGAVEVANRYRAVDDHRTVRLYP